MKNVSGKAAKMTKNEPLLCASAALPETFLFRSHTITFCQYSEGKPMGARRIRREQIQVDQASSRLNNGIRKEGEKARRAKRMKQLIKIGKPPYTPAVQSWLSTQTGKPARLITQEDVDAIMKD